MFVDIKVTMNTKTSRIIIVVVLIIALTLQTLNTLGYTFTGSYLILASAWITYLVIVIYESVKTDGLKGIFRNEKKHSKYKGVHR